MGLETGHGRAAVIQHDHGDIGFVVDSVYQGRHGTMEKSGIPTNGQDGLVHPKGGELAEPTGEARAGTHRMYRLGGAKSGSEKIHAVAADIATNETLAIVHFQDTFDGP